MAFWVLLSINGISSGLLIFILAAGLSLIFGLMRIVNLAHGSYYMLGAYVGFSVAKATGSFLFALVLAGVAIASVGVFMERVFLRHHKDPLEQVLLTLGFVYIFMDVAKFVWGGVHRSIATPMFLSSSINIIGKTYPVYRLAVIVIGLLTAAGLFLFLGRTRFGAIIRAGVDDKQMVAGLGINVGMVFTWVFALGAFLAALGGVIGGPILGTYIGIDGDILLLCMVVVIVGGMGTTQGALLGSILIGVVDAYAKALLPDLAMFTLFLTMAVVLVLKPSGILGKGGQ